MQADTSVLRKKRPAAGVSIFFMLVFLTMWVLNHFEIRWIDDYCRSATGSLTTILSATWGEYFGWTGRFFVTLLTRVLLDSRPPETLSVDFFDLINSIVFCAYVLFIFVFASGRRPRAVQDLPALILIFGLAICSTDAPSLAIFWKTGAINYLWAVTGEIYLLTKFLEFLNANEESSWGPVFKILFPGLCFLVANSSENVSLSVTIVLFGMLTYSMRYMKRKVPLVLWAATVAHVLGCVVLLVAPGNFGRMHAGMPKEPKPFVGKLISNLSHLASTIGLHGWLIVVIICVILYLRRERTKNGVRPEIPRVAVALATSVLSFLAITASPAAYGGRTAFASESFMICVLATLFVLRRESLRRDLVISVLCVVLVGWALGIKLDESIQISEQRDQRNALIASIKASGGSDVVLPPFSIRGVGIDKTRVKRWNMVQVGDIDADWSNKCFADTYQLQHSSRADVPKK